MRSSSLRAPRLLAFIVTLAVMASSVGARSRRRAQEARQELETTAHAARPVSARSLTLTPDDFLLPQASAVDTDLPYVPFRPRLEKWSAEMAGKYWIPPRDIAIDVLVRQRPEHEETSPRGSVVL